ncbi:MAG: TonB-dependent receptor plug domain-containing protein [Nonlabens sp.]|uniref:TonB-dependent receptor plug domain-containing protein n=1 Tax=Nonlabens sp. TaxID=1888209 RepID=UPI003EF86033
MLTEQLEFLEKEYNVIFNYSKALMDTYMVSSLTQENLDAYIYQIRTETGLTISKFSDHKFIVYKKVVAKEKHQELSEILLVGYINKGVNQFKDGSFSLDMGSSHLFPGLSSPDAFHSIQSLPGIQSIDETISNINIRGASNDQNLVLWNDIQIYQTGHFFGLISAFNTYPPHKVKVSKNLNDSRYTGAVAGVINMDYLLGDQKKTEFGAGVDFMAAHAYGNWVVNDNIALQLSIRKSITEFADTPSYEAYKRRILQATQLDSSAKMDFDFIDASFGIDIKLSDNDDFQLYGMLFENNLDYEKNSTQTTTSDISQNHYSVGYKYLKEINPDLILEHKSYFTMYGLRSLLVNQNAGSSLFQENDVKDFGTSLSATLKVNDYLSLNAGLETSQVSVFDDEIVREPDFTSKKITAASNHEFYIQSDYSNKSKTLDLSTGMRWSYLPFYNKLLWEPRMNASYKLNKTYQLIGNIQQANQNIFQVIDEAADFQGLEKRRWRLSDNDRYPIIQAQQASIALQRNENDLLLGIEAYAKTTDNTLSGSQNFSGVFKDRNAVGKTTSFGVEFIANKKIKSWSTWFSYHFNDSYSRFQALNNNERFPNSFNIRHHFNLSTSYSYKKWELAASTNFHNGVRYTPVKDLDQSVVVNDEIEYERINSSTLPLYLRTDVSINRSFKFKKTKLLLAASLWNVFNRKNKLNTYYQVGENNDIQPVVQESLGTVLNMSARVIFK